MLLGEHVEFKSIWDAALNDASGFVSAFLAPRGLAIDSMSVEALNDDPQNVFRKDINSRLDLGRVNFFVGLLPKIQGSINSAYRHDIFYSDGPIRGKIHIPRLLIAQAKGDPRTPVIKASRHYATPENLLISEVFNKSFMVTKNWVSRGGAEGEFARELLNGLLRGESIHPWTDIRSRTRPHLQELTGIVQGRAKMGSCPIGSVAHELSLVFSSLKHDPSSFKKVADKSEKLLSLAFAQNISYQDKVFELLCLAWMADALGELLKDVELSNTLVGKNKPPVVKGRYGEAFVALHFQRVKDILDKGRWKWQGKTPLGGLPDIILEIRKNAKRTLVLFDAKNRGESQSGDVAYKLLGYKENFSRKSEGLLYPFYAYGLFPAFGQGFSGKNLVRREHKISLLSLPLNDGRQYLFRELESILGVLA
jgi:hypothetical protein